MRAVFDPKFAKDVDAKNAKSLRPLCVKDFAFLALKTPHPKALRIREIRGEKPNSHGYLLILFILSKQPQKENRT